MIGFGWTNPFPLNFGGGESTKEDLRGAMVVAMEDFLDPDISSESYAEASGEAALLNIIWASNRRLSNQANPALMMENLEVWEESTGLKPTPQMTGPERRAELSAKLRGQLNNAIVDIEEVASKALGTNFDSVVLVDPDDVVFYQPGVNPGPPGYEFSSNRAHILIKMNKGGLNELGFLDKRDRLWQQIHALLPSWMTFEIGVGDSFVANVGILGQSIL